MVVDKCNEYLDSFFFFFFCILQRNNIHQVVILCNTIMIMATSTHLSGPGPAVLLRVCFMLVIL